MKIHNAYYSTRTGSIDFHLASGLLMVRERKVKKVPASVTRLLPRKECPTCQGFGAFELSGDRCPSCAGLGYTRS